MKAIRGLVIVALCGLALWLIAERPVHEWLENTPEVKLEKSIKQALMQHDFETAITYCRQGLAQAKPTSLYAAGYHNGLGHAFMGKKSYAAAESEYNEALRIYEKKKGSGDRRCGWTRKHLGNCYRVQGAFDRAAQYYKRAHEIQKDSVIPADVDLLEGYAETLKHLGGRAEAAILTKEATELRSYGWEPWVHM